MNQRNLGLAAGALIICALGSVAGKSAYAGDLTATAIYAFCGQPDCADGATPFYTPTIDSNGNIYGTTVSGGAFQRGVVFELSPRAGAYNYSVLHQFCRQKGCPDGSASGSNLIVDKKGNLYGTTEAGGTQDGGTMFELSRTKGKWTYAVLYDFCTKRHCADGRLPGSHIAYAGQASGQPYDGTSAIYGTTLSGGNSPDIAGGAGVAFELDSISGSQRRSESSLHVFCLKAGCSDGAVPFGVILDASGKLYGATVQGASITKALYSCSTRPAGKRPSFTPFAANPPAPMAVDRPGSLLSMRMETCSVRPGSAVARTKVWFSGSR